MFVYYYRIRDRHHRPVVSLAVLCDEHPDWRPDRFVYNDLGCELDFRFPMVKLIDYRQDEAALVESPNPFAAVILCSSRFSRRGMRPRLAGNGSFDWSRGFTIAGEKTGTSAAAFCVIDWMLALPPELDQSF